MNRVKKKKRKKKPSVVSNRVKIIDDDVDITFNEAVEEDLHGLIEDAPQIVGVIDERPLELRIGDYRNSDLWKPVGAEDSIENITNNIYSGSAAQTSTKNPPERINKIMQSSSSKYSDDYSPPRKRRDSDNNLKSRKSDASPMQRSSRRDEITYNRRSRESSDEYQERHGNASPSRDNRKYNTSPPRKNKRDRRDSDKSPIRRSKVDISSATGSRRDRDVSPERRNSDASPRRRNKVDDDMSPPRRNIKDYEQSPVKRYRRSSDGSSKRKAYDDMSPPRRNVKTYEKSPARRNVKEYDKSPSRRSRRDSDVSPKRKNNDGSPVGRNKAYDMSPPRRNTREYNKSPSRRSRRDSDVSPKRKNTDRSPVRRNKADNDTSPSRKVIRDYNKGLNRRSRRSSDVSPKRKFSDRSPVRRNRFDDDRSPSRGQIKDYDSSRRARNDLSPLRRLSRNSDIGANRSQRMDRSQSPSHTRRYNYEEMRKSSSLNSDDYENRNSNRAERKYNTESDGTPPRKYNSGKDTSPNISKTEKLEDSSSIKLKTSSGAPRKSRWDDDTPSQPRIQIERKSGLQRANELIEQNEFFKDLAGPSMAIVAPIVRDRKTGKIRDFKKEEEEATKKQEKEDEIKAKYDRWGKGLKQVEDATEKLSSELHEMNKPLARYADDEDLERHLKEMERDGDPMLQYLRKKKRRQDIDEGKTFKPQFEGEFMPNRYGVSPGHRWDGVDRSNGYEKKWFEVMNSRRAQQEDAYKWSTEDM